MHPSPIALTQPEHIALNGQLISERSGRGPRKSYSGLNKQQRRDMRLHASAGQVLADFLYTKNLDPNRFEQMEPAARTSAANRLTERLDPSSWTGRNPFGQNFPTSVRRTIQLERLVQALTHPSLRTTEYELPHNDQSALFDMFTSCHPTQARPNTITTRPGITTSSSYSLTLPGTSTLSVIVLGGGPGGIMTAAALKQAGITNVTVYDKEGTHGGIWTTRDLGTAINNPGRLKFYNALFAGAQGNGDGARGLVMRRFIGNIAREHGLTVKQGTVLGVEPGYMDHTTYIETPQGTETIRSNLVIDALGAQQPRPLRKHGKISFQGFEGHNVPNLTYGQRSLESEDVSQLRGGKIAIFGLGNSSIEILRQVQEANDRGANIDYTVFTHHPHQAVHTPDVEVEISGKKYMMYRDGKVTRASAIAGHLEHVDQTYRRALGEGRIVADVECIRRLPRYGSNGATGTCSLEVTVSPNSSPENTTRAQEQRKTSVSQMYAVIGWEANQELHQQLGIALRPDGTPDVDFSGEVHRKTGSDAYHAGYFTIGASLVSGNGVTVPGIMGSLPDMIATIVARETLEPERITYRK